MIGWLEPVIPHLKALHVIALALWVGGLFGLPLMLARHDPAIGQADFTRIRLASHISYVWVITPAAVTTIVVGTWLIFPITRFKDIAWDIGAAGVAIGEEPSAIIGIEEQAARAAPKATEAARAASGLICMVFVPVEVRAEEPPTTIVVPEGVAFRDARLWRPSSCGHMNSV